jgi:RNA polymerase sigma factor (sigma-70 family)
MKKLQPLDEQTLIHGIKNNHTMAIVYVYRKNFPAIANFIRLNGGNNDEAKDIFQDAMMVLFHNLQNAEFNLSCQLSTYIYSVSRNLWLTELKRKNRNTIEIQDVEELISDEETNVDEAKETLNLQQQLNKCLEELGEPCKNILTSYYIEQLSMQEIAKKMGYTNAENAKNQKYKCLLRLKKLFLKH